jgi:hypothetical protein
MTRSSAQRWTKQIKKVIRFGSIQIRTGHSLPYKNYKALLFNTPSNTTILTRIQMLLSHKFNNDFCAAVFTRKQLLDDLKEKRIYWKLKEEALDRTLWRTRFGRGYGPVVGQTTE